MDIRPVVTASVAVLLLAACSPREDGAENDGTWVGTVTTEGNVTTVVNESGSVWGGKARLVEEASIGVEAGEREYMFGSVDALAASEDRIFVLEGSPPTVRVYDMRGVHLFDIGSEGQGPGEFGNPMSMVIDAAGRVLVRDAGNDRMSVFSTSGELLDTWPLPGGFSTSAASVATPDGLVYTPQSVGRDPETRRAIVGMVPYDAEGEAGEPVVPPIVEHVAATFPLLEVSAPGGNRSVVRVAVPFAPRPVSLFSPTGAWLLGVGDAYRFELRHGDGRVTLVERHADVVAVSGDEADWNRSRTTESLRRVDPEWSWSGPDIPDLKPYFDDMFPDHSGRVWVRRSGPSMHYQECPSVLGTPDREPRPCWRGEAIHDLFDVDGRYLGEVEIPGSYRFMRAAFVRDDIVLMPWEDELGTIMVKRFRLVLPGEA